VNVAATSVNPTDLLMRAGAQAAMMKELRAPFIPGMEFSGTILDPGPTQYAKGQPVIGVLNPRTPRGGACAEIVAVSAKSIAPLSSMVDLVAAATVPMNALTAMLALESLALAPGARLLVTGGAGLLGGSAIQLATGAGLIVLANVGDKDRQLVEAIGAHHVLPREEGLEAALRAICPKGVDGLIDGALIGQRISHLVRDGGCVASLRSSYKIDDPRLRVHYVSVLAGLQATSKLEHIATLIGSGGLLTRVADGGRFAAHDAIAAHRMAEAPGVRGRVVIVFDA
jgi:NADPH:quinone reductase-like Zn-dependent oxidoreductase